MTQRELLSVRLCDLNVSIEGTWLEERIERVQDELAQRDLRFNPRALRVEPEQLQQLVLPCVLHWDLNHFVVLTEVRGGSVTMHDPARGVRSLSLDQLSRHFTGVALELTPAADFAPRVERQAVQLKDLIGPVRGLKRSLAQILLLAVALEAFVLGSPFLLQWVVDDVVVSADRDLLLTLGIGFSLLVLLQVGLGIGTLVLQVPLSLALGHQALAFMLTGAIVAWLADMGPRRAT